MAAFCIVLRIILDVTVHVNDFDNVSALQNIVFLAISV